MAGWFGRSASGLSEVQETGSRLGVFTLTLTGVEEPFDPDPVWDRRYGGRAEIAERLTGDNEFRLQAALEGCRNSVFVRDDAGRFREANPVFSDVVMWIPEASWRADAMRGGPRLQLLQHSLASLHADKFARSLPEDRAPRYTIMADRQLPADHVAFQFGFGVFVPGPEDELESEIVLRRPGDDGDHELPPWLFWHDGAQTRRPVGVYRGQRSLLISGSAEGPVRPDLWFGDRTGHILVNLNEADAERVYADSDDIRVVEMREPEGEAGVLEWRLDSEASGQRETLWVRIAAPSPGTAAQARPASPTIGVAPDARAAEPKPAPRREVGIHSATPATPLSSRFDLQLAGIALFKIDAARMPGLEEWTVWLDEDGWPVSEKRMDGIDEPTCLALRSHISTQHIAIRAEGTTQFESAPALPCSISTANGGKLELLSSPVPSRYQAILMLSDQLVLPLSSESLVLGRASAQTEAEPDLPIEVLNHPRGARWEQGAAHSAARLDALELSRRHLRVRLCDRQLEVGMEKGNASAFVLDAEGQLRSEIAPQSPELIQLEVGHHLLVGGYLFRFREEQPRAMASTGVHLIPQRND